MATVDFAVTLCPLCGYELCAIEDKDVQERMDAQGVILDRTVDCPNCGSMITLIYARADAAECGTPETFVAGTECVAHFTSNALALPSRTPLTIFCSSCGMVRKASIHLDPVIAVAAELTVEGDCPCNTHLEVKTLRGNNRTVAQAFVITSY